MKFSIIVPVYNVENYLSECLESLVHQNFDDYEIVLINDGSSDSSSKICEEYDQKYKKVMYYSKDNGGLSDARNYGMSKAKGDYLIFVDSDDWIAEETLVKFNDVLDAQVDVLITRITEVYPDESQPRDIGFEHYLASPLTQDRAVEWIMKKTENSWPAVKYIVSRKFVESNNLLFKVGRLHEDLDWTSNMCLYATSYAGFSDEWYYHRMERKGSITNSIRTKNIVDTVEMAGDFFRSNSENESYAVGLIKERMMLSVYAKLHEIKKCPKEEKNLVVNTIKSNYLIFSVAPKKKYRLFVKIMNLAGPSVALRLLSAI